jgi:hypothetical protein
VPSLTLLHTLILSLSKDESFCSWFDKLTTSDVYSDLELATNGPSA